MTKAIQTTYQVTLQYETPIDDINKKLNIDFEKDVEHYYVKWSTLYLYMKDGALKEYDLDVPDVSSDDFKRPDNVRVIDADV